MTWEDNYFENVVCKLCAIIRIKNVIKKLVSFLSNKEIFFSQTTVVDSEDGCKTNGK